MVRVSRVLPGSICDEMGVVPGTELLTVNGRELARLPRLGVPHRRRRAGHRGPPARRRGRRLRGRAARRRGTRASSSSRRPFAAAPTAASSASSRGCPKGSASRSTSATTIIGSRSPTATSRRSPTSRSATSQRILEYRLSPLYVSVHATPWEARKVLLNNPRVPNIVEQLTRLAAGGIQFHGQMVDRAGPQRRRRARGSRSPTSGISATPCCQRRARAGRA